MNISLMKLYLFLVCTYMDPFLPLNAASPHTHPSPRHPLRDPAHLRKKKCYGILSEHGTDIYGIRISPQTLH